jgi:peroxiredoxin
MKLLSETLSRYYTWLIMLLLSLGLIWIAANRTNDNDPRQTGVTQPYQGFVAPDFKFPGPSGNSVKLSDLRGHPVIVNFWASWCPPCRAEMPAIQAVHQSYQEHGLVVLGVNAANQDSLDQAQEFIKDTELTFQVLFDSSGEIQSLYEISALPTTFFIDRTGVIQEVVIGGPIAEALLEIHAEEILDGEP